MTPELARATLAAIEKRQDELEAEEAALEALAQACANYLMVTGAPYDGRQAQPGSSGPAGAGGLAGEVEAAPPSSASAPIEQPDPEVTEAAAVAPRDAAVREADALPPDPVSTSAEDLGHGPMVDRGDGEECLRCNMLRSTIEKGALAASETMHAARPAEEASSRPRKGPSPGNVIDVDCVCGRHFTWKPGLANHQKGCEDYLEAATAPTPARPEAVLPHDEPVVRKGQEWWVCGRCPERFKTRARRDSHERLAHPPEARGKPVGTQRPLGHLGIPAVPGGGGML